MTAPTIEVRLRNAQATQRIKRASAMAARAKRRFYLVDQDDARQEALLTMYEAERRYEASSASLETYVTGAAKSQLVTFVWRSTCPVHLTSYSLRDDQRRKDRVAKLAAHELEPSRTNDEQSARTPEQLRVGEPGDAEADLDRYRLRLRVAALVLSIEPTREVAEAAMRVLSEESRVPEEARLLVNDGVVSDADDGKKWINKTAKRLHLELMRRKDLLDLVRSIG